MNNQNKPEWEKEFDEKFIHGVSAVSPKEIKSFIFSLLSKAIDEIELEQGEFHTSPIDERFDAGYDKAVVDLEKVKSKVRLKYITSERA